MSEIIYEIRGDRKKVRYQLTTTKSTKKVQKFSFDFTL